MGSPPGPTWAGAGLFPTLTAHWREKKKGIKASFFFFFLPGTAIKIEAVPSLHTHTHCRGLTSAAGEGGDETKAEGCAADGPKSAARVESRAGAPADSSPAAREAAPRRRWHGESG